MVDETAAPVSVFSSLTAGLFFPQVTLKLQESQLPGPDQLQQFQVVCETEEDKFLLLYALLKLSLIRGKSLLFVNSLERSYRLRLFLEQFSIPTCVLNGELPLRSRFVVAALWQGCLKTGTGRDC